ncbi:MAG: DUF721 domain-containing protein [Candidatus Babeliales bacterium]
MATSLKDLLQNIVPHQTSWKTELQQNWHHIVGHLATHVQLLKVYENALLLGVKDSSWLQEMYLLSPLLIETINKSLDKPYINKLHFKNVGDGEQTQQTRAPQPKEKKPLPPQLIKKHVTKFQQETLERVEDPELRESLKQLLLTCREEPE